MVLKSGRIFVFLNEFIVFEFYLIREFWGFSILALAKILEHAIATEDTRFQSIFVKGDRIINPVEGIKTRSKSKTGL